MNEFWWNRLPRSVSHFSPMLTVTLSDGLYLAAWRELGTFAPPLAWLLGFLIGWFHFSSGDTFTFSIWVMALMLSISSFGAGLGAWLCLGYAMGDFLLFPHLQNPDWLNLNTWLYIRVPLILSYILLATLLVSIPLTTKGLRRLIFPGLEEKLPQLPVNHRWVMTVIAAGLQALLQGAFVYVWTQAVPTLIRPVYTWRGNQPPIQAIQPLQTNGHILVAIAVILGFLRIFLEYYALNHSSVIKQVTLLQQDLNEKISLKPFPFWIAVPLKAAFSTFMLSGILTSWKDAIFLGVSLLLALFLREGILIRLDARLIDKICYIPLILRIFAALLINYFLTIKIVEAMWNDTSNTFLPIVISTILSFIVFALLLPSPSQREEKAIAARDKP